MKKSIPFFILFLMFHCSFSQTSDEPVQNICPEAIPVSETASVETIAAYINRHHKTEKEKITAIYCWLGHNIAYDIAKASDISHSTTNAYDKYKAIRHTLTARKGVCQDYAELMEALCEKCGIKVHPAYGIVRKQEQIGEAHAWIIAWIDQQWRIYDPTWGAGYVNNGVFSQRFDFKFYDMLPENAIKSHLPLDPIWQLLPHPIPVESFYQNDFQKKPSTPFFNFSDTIALFEEQDSIEQCYNMIRRIEANGIYNQATVDYLTYLNSIIENDKVHCFNQGVHSFNGAVALLNEYSRYYNTQFNPEKSQEDVEQMLYEAEFGIKIAMQYFQFIKNPSSDMSQNINGLYPKMKNMSQQLAEHKKFVEKYFNADPAIRKKLFYQ